MESQMSGSSMDLTNDLSSRDNNEVKIEEKCDDEIYRNPQVLLVEDSTLTELPTHLNMILEPIYKEQRPTRTDLLYSILYALALETGFTCTDIKENDTGNNSINWGYSFDYKNVIKFAKLPLNIKQYDGQVHNMQLQMPYLTNEIFNLMSLNSGESVIINLTSRNKIRPGRSIFLSVSRYVPIINVKCLPRCFRRLNELSVKMKNDIFLPLRNELYLEGNFLHPSLPGLPAEVIFLLIRYLNTRSRFNLAMTCKTLHNIGIKK